MLMYLTFCALQNNIEFFLVPLFMLIWLHDCKNHSVHDIQKNSVLLSSTDDTQPVFKKLAYSD